MSSGWILWNLPSDESEANQYNWYNFKSVDFFPFPERLSWCVIGRQNSSLSIQIYLKQNFSFIYLFYLFTFLKKNFQFCCTWNGKDECTPKNSWWLSAPIVKYTTSSVTLDGTVCGSDQFIAGVRYAWRISPCIFKKCAVYSQSNDLPAPPFIFVKPNNSSTEFTYTIDWSKPQVIPWGSMCSRNQHRYQSLSAWDSSVLLP